MAAGNLHFYFTTPQSLGFNPVPFMAERAHWTPDYLCQIIGFSVFTNPINPWSYIPLAVLMVSPRPCSDLPQRGCRTAREVIKSLSRRVTFWPRSPPSAPTHPGATETLAASSPQTGQPAASAPSPNPPHAPGRTGHSAWHGVPPPP